MDLGRGGAAVDRLLVGVHRLLVGAGLLRVHARVEPRLGAVRIRQRVLPRRRVELHDPLLGRQGAIGFGGEVQQELTGRLGRLTGAQPHAHAAACLGRLQEREHLACIRQPLADLPQRALDPPRGDAGMRQRRHHARGGDIGEVEARRPPFPAGRPQQPAPHPAPDLRRRYVQDAGELRHGELRHDRLGHCYASSISRSNTGARRTPARVWSTKLTSQ